MRLHELLTNKDKNLIIQADMEIVHDMDIGDYTLALIRDMGMYQISLARQGLDVVDYKNQLTKFPLEAPPSFEYMDLIFKQVAEWAKKYNGVVVGSEDPNKERVYNKLFKRFGPRYGLASRIARVGTENHLIVTATK
jgi:hypothetical protein